MRLSRRHGTAVALLGRRAGRNPPDRIEGRGGRDSVAGDAGSDVVLGGTGDDVSSLDAGDGDRIDLGPGRDFFFVENGDGTGDVLDGGDDADAVSFATLDDGAFSTVDLARGALSWGSFGPYPAGSDSLEEIEDAGERPPPAALLRTCARRRAAAPGCARPGEPPSCAAGSRSRSSATSPRASRRPYG